MINQGSIINGNYVKYCVFSKAVLWKDKALSLPVATIEMLKDTNTQNLFFVDKAKNEIWQFTLEEVLENSTVKQVGQETQHYFPIALATIQPYQTPVSETPSDKEKTLKKTIERYLRCVLWIMQYMGEPDQESTWLATKKETERLEDSLRKQGVSEKAIGQLLDYVGHLREKPNDTELEKLAKILMV